jgi:hypothetical protein
MTQHLLSVERLMQFHDALISSDGQHSDSSLPLSQDQQLGRAVQDNHRFNCLLWAEEDLARRLNVPDSAIAANKRAIDGFNQKRNDATERIDEALLNHLSNIARAPSAAQNSETPGAMIDRLSILALKTYHMRLQTLRRDVDDQHRRRCSEKLELLREQRSDLALALDRLLESCMSGVAFFKVYRQFKMYNDPSLNPKLYEKTGPS